MAADVFFPDLELFLTKWLKAQLDARPEALCHGVVVANAEPAPSTAFPDKLVVIRDDGGPKLSVVSAQRLVGVSTIMGVRANRKDVGDLSRIVQALLESCARVEAGNPVADVPESNGPYPVSEASGRGRQYGTLEMVIVGKPL